MKKILLQLGFAATLAAFVFTSCSDDDVAPWVEPQFGTTGAFIITEGQGDNASELSYYDIEKDEVTYNVFSNQNNKKLGSIANDGIVYGSKMYFAVTVSNEIFVTDLTGKLVSGGQITTANAALAGCDRPRYLASHNGYVYVDFYSGHIAKIDTTSLQVVAKLPIQVYPEQMAVVAAKNEMYIAQSNYYESTVVGETVTVVDLNTFKVKGEPIKVGLNPQKVAADRLGNVFVVSSGNYDNIKDQLNIIDSDTKTVTKTIPEIATYIAVQDSKLLMIRNHWIDGEGYSLKYSQYDIHTNTQSDESFVKIPEEHKKDLSAPYSINIDPIQKDIYITTSVPDGEDKVFSFSKSGDFKTSFNSEGKFPNKVMFIQEQIN